MKVPYLLIVPLLLAICACQSSGPYDSLPDGKTVELSPEESRISFPLADSTSSKREFYAERYEAGHQVMEYGFWSSNVMPFARAMVLFRKMDPDYFIQDRDRIEDFVQSLSFAQEESVQFDETKDRLGARAFNGRGAFRSRHFVISGINCIGFEHFWGKIRSGTRQLYGYYCADPGAAIADTHLQAVQTGVSIEGE